MSKELWSDQQKLKTCSCWCGIPFAVPETLMRIHKKTKGKNKITCPLGHGVVFSGETEADRLRKELEFEQQRRRRAEALAAQERGAAAYHEHRARAFKGHLTRTKNRIGAGVCPCCDRSFTNLRRHMESKHPDYRGADEEATP